MIHFGISFQVRPSSSRPAIRFPQRNMTLKGLHGLGRGILLQILFL
ncbi:hypothetical protein LCGC14_2304620, partial [marine sediment metagenome]